MVEVKTPEIQPENDAGFMLMIFREKSFQAIYDLERKFESRPSVRDKHNCSPNALFKLQSHNNVEDEEESKE